MGIFTVSQFVGSVRSGRFKGCTFIPRQEFFRRQNKCIMEETMRKMKQKSMYLKVRLPVIKASGGGAHQPAKGGKYRRSREKHKARQDARAELE